MAPKSSVDVFLRLHGQRKFSKEVATSAAELEAMGLKGARSMAAFAASSEKLKSFGKSWTRHVTLPTALGVGLAAKAAIDWESAFAGVRKTVNATQAQFTQMEHGLRSMALHIPVAATDLAGIAEAAGQLGVKRTAILGFTRVIADLGVATNLAGEEGATTLARFANITQMPQSQFDRLGSTIVALGNAGASTESDIAAMGLRIAAAGNYVGMSEPQILGYANALSSVGIEAEAGGSAISTVFKIINSAVDGGGAKLEAFAGIAGESSSAFAKHWKQDAASASVTWIEGLSRLKKEGEDVPAVLDALSPKLRGLRVQDALLRASGAGDLLRESLGLGAKAWKQNTALTEEASKRYKTVASRLQILKNKFIDAGITLGQELLPPLIEFVEFAGPKVGAVAEAFGALPGPVKATALGLLLLTGPVVSGLGYFAGGIGRALVLTKKLAVAGKSLQIFNSAIGAGQTLGTATEMAFKGGGAAGALNMAKGFAFSLGPAVAAFGIGNIVTSATSGDWRDAGFEMGGAAAGGIAGFMLGGPLGAMIGVGLGSLGGELGSKLFDGIFGSGNVPSLQEKIARSSKEVTKYFKQQKEAGVALGAATRRVTGAHRRLKGSSVELRDAERVLSTTKRRSGESSDAAAEAEWRLTLAQDKHRRATRRLNNAEREKGQSLRWFKQIARSTVLEERNSINNLRRRKDHIKDLFREEEQAGAGRARLTELSHRGVNVSNELTGAQKKYKETLTEASSKAGPKFASFLSNANRQSLEFGSALKAVNARLRVTTELTRGLSEAEPFATPNLGNIGSGVTGLPAGPKAPIAGPPRPSGGSGPRKHPPTAPRPRKKSFKKGEDALRLTGDVVHQTVLSLDGKVLAESVTRHATKAANRG